VIVITGMPASRPRSRRPAARYEYLTKPSTSIGSRPSSAGLERSTMLRECVLRRELEREGAWEAHRQVAVMLRSISSSIRWALQRSVLLTARAARKEWWPATLIS